MNSPVAGAWSRPVNSENGILFRKLNEAITQRENATPEYELPEGFVNNFRLGCAMSRSHFKPHKAERIRKLIYQSDYWERECSHYKQELEKLLWQEACAAYPTETKVTERQWRTLARLYHRLLRHKGLSPAQIEAARQESTDQVYWEYEMDILDYFAAVGEEELRDKLHAERDRRLNEEGQAGEDRDRQTDQANQVEGSHHSKRSRRTNAEAAHGGGIASRTRSKTGASVIAKVTKRVLRPRTKR